MIQRQRLVIVCRNKLGVSDKGVELFAFEHLLVLEVGLLEVLVGEGVAGEEERGELLGFEGGGRVGGGFGGVG